MEERLKTYLKIIDFMVEKLEETTADEDSRQDKVSRAKKDLLIQIQFFQHERLVHLLVTILFAIMTIITFGVVMVAFSIWSVALLLLLVILLIPYIRHYYILENGTQKLYQYYDRLEALR